MDIATDGMVYAVRTAQVEQVAVDSAGLIIREKLPESPMRLTLIDWICPGEHCITRSLSWIGGRQCHWNEKDS